MTALHNEYSKVSIEKLCGLFDKRRQWYYNKRKTVVSEQQRVRLILSMVDYYRQCCPGLGGVKLHHLLKQDLGVEITHGRDAFLRLLSSKGLMLKKPKRRRTTNSNHLYKKYSNLAQGLEVNQVNQLWVADITYVWIAHDVLYLHLVTDAYSHAVIGWCLSETMEAENTRKALLMAIQKAGGDNLCGTIHHSDRGVQYACNEYIDTLMSHHIRVSMTECYKPTDNAIAERQNGTFKVEWIYQHQMYQDFNHAQREIAQMIDFYNLKRPHMSIGKKTPMAVYSGEEPGPNLWKKEKNCRVSAK